MSSEQINTLTERKTRVWGWVRRERCMACGTTSNAKTDASGCLGWFTGGLCDNCGSVQIKMTTLRMIETLELVRARLLWIFPIRYWKGVAWRTEYHPEATHVLDVQHESNEEEVA